MLNDVSKNFPELHNPPLERTDHCERHGEYTAKCHIGATYSKCPECVESARADERQRQEAEDQRRRDRAWQLKLGECGIPLRFQDRSLGSFCAELDGQVRALDFAKAYAAEFEHAHAGRCAIFIGEPGTGKTHLACGIALRIMHRYGRSAVFTTVAKMVRRIREAKSFEAAETESEAIKVYVYPDLLILDEVGIQSGTDAEARALFDVINERYEQRKPTIFLTNLDLDGVRMALGERVYDRMREDGGESVAFDWESQRGKAA